MWCNVWGHSKSELVSAIKTQSSKLQHSPMFNLTNEPTELLAKLLVNQSPGMSHVFFSDNGSTSMEMQQKMASSIGQNLTYTWRRFALRIKWSLKTLESCSIMGRNYLNVQS